LHRTAICCAPTETVNDVAVAADAAETGDAAGPGALAAPDVVGATDGTDAVTDTAELAGAEAGPVEPHAAASDAMRPTRTVARTCFIMGRVPSLDLGEAGGERYRRSRVPTTTHALSSRVPWSPIRTPTIHPQSPNFVRYSCHD
jgi:hypothetical protein